MNWRVLLMVFFSATAIAESWTPEQDPYYWDANLIRNFSKLSASESLSGKSIPWTTTYWADFQSGVAHRWNVVYPEDYTYTPPSLERLKKMIASEKNKLSPAEKWDIMHSRYTYPTVLSERKRTKADEVTWAGLCHGWSLAAMSFEEPQNFRSVNAEGIELILNSTDIKALVSLAISPQANDDSVLLGTRCYREGRKNPTNMNTYECMGVNAGSFHLAMANALGVQKKSFVTNISRDQEIWNHPAYGYDSEVIGEAGPSRHASPMTVKEVRIETHLYLVEMQDPLVPDPVQGTIDHPLISKKYVYWLELDVQGNIVGGTWETFWHPGFVWKNKSAIRAFTGLFEGLEQVLKAR